MASLFSKISQAAKTVKSTVQKAVQSASATVARAASGVSSAIKTAGQYVAKVAAPVVSVVSNAAKSVGSAAVKAGAAAVNTVKNVASTAYNYVSTGAGAVIAGTAGLLGLNKTATVSYSTTPAQMLPSPTSSPMPFNPSSPTPQNPSPTPTYYGGTSSYSPPATPGQASVPSDSMFGGETGGVSIGDPGSPGTGIAMGEQTLGQAANGLVYALIAGGALLVFT